MDKRISEIEIRYLHTEIRLVLGEGRPCSQLEELQSRPLRRFDWLRFWMRTVAYDVSILLLGIRARSIFEKQGPHPHGYSIDQSMVSRMLIDRKMNRKKEE